MRLTFLQYIPGFKRLHTWRNLRRFAGRKVRQLDIGPWNTVLPGFERLDIAADVHLPHYFSDATQLPFADNTFNLVHASHVLEHIPWYQSRDVLREWARVVKVGGKLEVCVPDGEFICRAFLHGEGGQMADINSDGWFRFNPNHDPCLWASYRIYAYGDGKGCIAHPNWHRALFSKRMLREMMQAAGLCDITDIRLDQLRVRDHIGINLGLVGTKV